jgi:ABC-type amino acid transport substrate-binding protein
MSHVAVATVTAALAASLSSCTPPNGTEREPLTDKTSTNDLTAAAGATSNGVLRVRGSDGSFSMVSRGSASSLSAIPTGVPIIGGDVDLVQAVTSGRQTTGYYVIVTVPGAPSTVYAGIERSLLDYGFVGEDGSVAENDAARVGWSMAAGVFATDRHRVTVGVVPAGRASSTVTYAIVPASL